MHKNGRDVIFKTHSSKSPYMILLASSCTCWTFNINLGLYFQNIVNLEVISSILRKTLWVVFKSVLPYIQFWNIILREVFTLRKWSNLGKSPSLPLQLGNSLTVIFSGPFLLINFSKKLPFLSKGKVLFKYGNLELYWLHSEWWNILLR